MITRRRITDIIGRIAGGLPAAFLALLVLAPAAVGCGAAPRRPRQLQPSPVGPGKPRHRFPVLHWRSCYGGSCAAPHGCH